MVTGSGIGVPPTGVRVALKVTDWLTVGAVLDAVRVSWVGCLVTLALTTLLLALAVTLSVLPLFGAATVVKWEVKSLVAVAVPFFAPSLGMNAV